MNMQRPSQVRKRLVLSALAMMQLAFAISSALNPFTSEEPGRALIFEMIPLPWRLSLWIIFGVVASALAITRAHRAGWVLIMVMPTTRLLGNAWSALMFIIPGWPPGTVEALPNTFFWAAWTILVWALAGWPDLNVHTKGMRRGQDRAEVREHDREIIRSHEERVNQIRSDVRDHDHGILSEHEQAVPSEGEREDDSP